MPAHGKIKLGYFGTKGIPAHYGGFETIANNLARRIDTEFFELYVSQEDPLVREVSLNEIYPSVFQVRYPKSWAYKISGHLGNILTEARMLNKLEADGLGLDAVMQCGSTPGLFLENLKNKKRPLILINPDGIEWKRKKFPLWGRLYLYLATFNCIRVSHAVTLDSKSLEPYFHSILKTKPIYYLPSGAKNDNLKESKTGILNKYGLTSNGYFILVARMVPENQIVEICQWFRKASTNRKLVIVTNCIQARVDFSYERAFLETIFDAPNIVNLGPIYEQEILQELRVNAYAYFHGHSVGGTNPSLLESMGAGCPPICFDVSFNREVAQDAGLYFSNEEEFLEDLELIEGNEKIRDRMRERCHSIIEKKFDWDYVTRMHEITVLDLLCNNGLRPYSTLQHWVEKHENLFEIRFLERKTKQETIPVGRIRELVACP